ncbi:MAG: transcriptional regulator [Desulfotignum sp.]|nr:transcriptional regulator [Desulfotignum sp.]
MDQLASNLKRYLKETLDIDVRPKKWLGAGNLPIFLRNMYAFFEVRILDTPCLVMATKDKTEQTPATIHKHMLQVRKKWQDEVIYVRQQMTAYNRKRLIQHKIPFVIPLNQMYLPFLGIDLREHFKKIRETAASFSPSTQAVVLYYLSQNRQLHLTPKKLANELGYSIMTMTRALDELNGAGLGTIAMEGRERVLRFHRDKKQVWETALERLRSPVKKRLWVKAFSNQSFGLSAGLSALAHYSNLAAPKNPVLALEGKHWKKVNNTNDVMILAIAEANASKLEIWSYSPKLFGENGVVDRFSLFLSMREDNDERVQSALKGMMEGVEW